jgi:glycosyltransferase involved in cell wall biosynthesis
MKKPDILVLTSSYPKKQGDSNGIFIHEFNKELSVYVNPVVIVPMYNGASPIDSIEDIPIYRHKQFLFNSVELAYGTDIMAKLKQNWLYYFIVPFYFIYELILIRKIVRIYHIELIFAPWLVPSAFVASLYKAIFNKKIKVVVTLLGADIWSCNHGLKKNILKFTLNRMDAVTAQSVPLLEEVLKLGFHHEALHCPIGIDINRFTPEKRDPEIRRKYGIREQFLLFVGSLIERKGALTLVKSMALVRDTFPDVKLLMVGCGNKEAEIKQCIEKLRLDHNIILTGNIPNHELPAYFAAADIFVLPSLSEGFPLVVMEALSCGTITVVSDLPVYRSMKTEENFLTLVEKNNPVSLANAILGLLKDKELLQKKRMIARNFAVRNFDNHKIALEYWNLFQKTLTV